MDSNRFSLKTPVLRAVVNHLNDLDKKLSQTIVRLDNFVFQNPTLKKVLKARSFEEKVGISLREELIKIVMPEILKQEAIRATWPKPGTVEAISKMTLEKDEQRRWWPTTADHQKTKKD